jgi:hypothetical protein
VYSTSKTQNPHGFPIFSSHDSAAAIAYKIV